MHAVLEQLFQIFAQFPSLFLHLLLVVFQVIGIVALRIVGLELASFSLCHVLQFLSYGAGQLSALAKNHVPDVVGNHAPAFLALFHLNDVHQRQVLHIL